MQTVPLISYQEFLSILLTAVGVALALVAIELGVLAIWGYKGLRRLANTRVAAAMDKKLREFPNAAEIVKICEDIKKMYEEMKAMHETSAETLAQLQMQMNANPAPAGAESDEGISDTYPGEEPGDVDDEPRV